MAHISAGPLWQLLPVLTVGVKVSVSSVSRCWWVGRCHMDSAGRASPLPAFLWIIATAVKISSPSPRVPVQTPQQLRRMLGGVRAVIWRRWSGTFEMFCPGDF